MLATPKAADLPAELARRQVRLFEIALKVGVHPARLGAMLRERLPPPPVFLAELGLSDTKADGIDERLSIVWRREWTFRGLT